MNAALDESFFYYRHKCRLEVHVDTQEQRVVLPIGTVGALFAPLDLSVASEMPVIRHPDGRRCTILTEGSMRVTGSYRAGLGRTGISIAEPGSWVVLPMSDNDPEFGWVWTPKLLEPNFTLPRPSTVFAALNSTPAAHDAMSSVGRR